MEGIPVACCEWQPATWSVMYMGLAAFVMTWMLMILLQIRLFTVRYCFVWPDHVDCMKGVNLIDVLGVVHSRLSAKVASFSLVLRYGRCVGDELHQDDVVCRPRDIPSQLVNIYVYISRPTAHPLISMSPPLSFQRHYCAVVLQPQRREQQHPYHDQPQACGRPAVWFRLRVGPYPHCDSGVLYDEIP